MALFASGQKTVTAAGTAEKLAANGIARFVKIKALAGNLGDVFVGASDVAAANGYVLDAGESLVITHPTQIKLADIWLDVGTSGEGVSFVYFV